MKGFPKGVICSAVAALVLIASLPFFPRTIAQKVNIETSLFADETNRSRTFGDFMRERTLQTSRTATKPVSLSPSYSTTSQQSAWSNPDRRALEFSDVTGAVSGGIDSIGGVIGGISDGVSAVTGFITGTINGIGGSISDMFAGIGGSGAFDDLKALGGDLMSVYSSIGDLAGDIVELGGNVASSVGIVVSLTESFADLYDVVTGMSFSDMIRNGLKISDLMNMNEAIRNQSKNIMCVRAPCEPWKPNFGSWGGDRNRVYIKVDKPNPAYTSRGGGDTNAENVVSAVPQVTAAAEEGGVKANAANLSAASTRTAALDAQEKLIDSNLGITYNTPPADDLYSPFAFLSKSQAGNALRAPARYFNKDNESADKEKIEIKAFANYRVGLDSEWLKTSMSAFKPLNELEMSLANDAAIQGELMGAFLNTVQAMSQLTLRALDPGTAAGLAVATEQTSARARSHIGQDINLAVTKLANPQMAPMFNDYDDKVTQCLAYDFGRMEDEAALKTKTRIQYDFEECKKRCVSRSSATDRDKCIQELDVSGAAGSDGEDIKGLLYGACVTYEFCKCCSSVSMSVNKSHNIDLEEALSDENPEFKDKLIARLRPEGKDDSEYSLVEKVFLGSNVRPSMVDPGSEKDAVVEMIHEAAFFKEVYGDYELRSKMPGNNEVDNVSYPFYSNGDASLDQSGRSATKTLVYAHRYPLYPMQVSINMYREGCPSPIVRDDGSFDRVECETVEPFLIYGINQALRVLVACHGIESLRDVGDSDAARSEPGSYAINSCDDIDLNKAEALWREVNLGIELTAGMLDELRTLIIPEDVTGPNLAALNKKTPHFKRFDRIVDAISIAAFRRQHLRVGQFLHDLVISNRNLTDVEIANIWELYNAFDAQLSRHRQYVLAGLEARGEYSSVFAIVERQLTNNSIAQATAIRNVSAARRGTSGLGGAWGR